MKTSKRILAISDVHGYKHLLKKLLKEANYSPDQDQLVLLGDYINKGPNSIGTLKLVRKLHQEGAIALLGNNESNWLKSNKKQAQEWAPFLHSLLYWKKVNSFVFVHSSVKQGIPLKEQSKKLITGLYPPAFDKIPGKVVVFGHTPTFRLGAKAGHVWLNEGLIGIDTGAGHGRRLSLVDLTNWRVYTVHTRGKKHVRQYVLSEKVVLEHVQ